MKINFFSFSAQNSDSKEEIFKSIKRVIDSNWYILGQNLLDFESNFKKLNKVKYAIGVGSGLDALSISLRALNIKQNDEVIVASNAYIASWLSITNAGASIVPVEPDEKTFNIDSYKIEEKITKKTKAIMPVHLYGQPCEMDQIMVIAKKYNLFVVEDNAQAHLATFDNKLTGTFGKINATSFYPTKNIGAIGEAGCITTNDKELSLFASKYRNYGSSEKYICDVIGTNSRLDEIQAAILNVKLKHIEKWTIERQKIAQLYNQRLSEIIETPFKHQKSSHVYHLYVIKTSKRDKLQEFLSKRNIGTAIHYPIPPTFKKHMNI